MRLMTVTLERYRRFEARASVDVSGDVVALVGPNEAGKSSILLAMLSHYERTPFTIRERTRGTEGRTKVTAGYVLDDADRAELRDIHGGGEVQWWTLEKHDGGNYVFELHPAPKRDLEPRRKKAMALRSFAEQEQLSRFDSIESSNVARLYKQTLATLLSDDDDLSDAKLEAIHRFAQGLQTLPTTDSEDDEDADPTEQGISSAFHVFLLELADYSEDLDPHVVAGRRLIDRRPQFLEFGPTDRDLRTTYDLDELIEDPPSALANLSRLAGLNLHSLLDASKSGNRGLRATLIEDANAELRRVFAVSWRQSQVSVRLELQETVLEVLVSLPGGGYTEIEERSAGLLWFVALRAFMSKYDLSVPPILLVDEAETHLHYDAQADLINLFTNQQLAAKVIYTTHSAGCLPRDLGNGIRVVVPSSKSERSSVKNSVWDGREVGFTPIVLGMGATTFAFLPARQVVLGEGVTDAMLYPTLFREATGQQSLAFQVAPGLAVATRARMLGLTNEGGAVLFITDGDAAGLRYRRELEEEGIPEAHIFSLDRVFGEQVELEDLVEPGAYASAINNVLRVFQRAKIMCLPVDIPPTGRVHALEMWCESRQLKPPDKTKVVQRLLDMKSEAARQGIDIKLLAEPRRDLLAQLYSDIGTAFTPTSNRRRRR